MYASISIEKKNKYIELLKTIGSLSKLFNDSPTPFLHYRAHENIFCLTLDAENLSRSDLSYDARIDQTGFGLKTFLHNNGNTLQKIAEFNAVSNRLRELAELDLIREVARLRNKRIETTNIQYAIDQSIYHCLTRRAGHFNIHECALELINIDNIVISKISKNNILFDDNINEYSYSLSKSTLLKRFELRTPVESFEVKIINNPFEEILKISRNLADIQNANLLRPGIDYICLPLYAPSDNVNFAPALKSGLNQWNAKGRQRDPNEVYIPVPSWIHSKCAGFLPRDIETNFDIELPNRTILSAKLCQGGAKGLMSNPNKALGKWLLRDLLKLEEGTIVTREILDEANIDSIILYKKGTNKYKIDLASIGKFKAFEDLFI